jgi:hypothetical protein
MKTPCYVFAAMLLLVLPPFPSEAQIPNAGFEEWNDVLGEPKGWMTNNMENLTHTVTQSSTSHSGSSALRGEVLRIPLALIAPCVTAGHMGNGFPVSHRYAVLAGYYQFSPVEGDQLSVAVNMRRNGNSIGSGTVFIPAAADSYTLFTAPITYSSDEVPDTCFIAITIVGSTLESDYLRGSAMLVDDLSFSEVVVVRENNTAKSQLPRNFALKQNHPNPFNPATTIGFALPHAARATLVVYNPLGREIVRLVDQELLGGSYEVTWTPIGLPTGIYFYRLYAGRFAETKKLLFLK